MTDFRPGSIARSRRQASNLPLSSFEPRLMRLSLLLQTLVAFWKATAPVKLPRSHCLGMLILASPYRHGNSRVVFHLSHKISLAQDRQCFHLAYTTIQ